METKFQSSFIPRGPLAPTSAAVLSTKSKQKSFFGFIAFLIFIFAVVGSIGVYGYEKYLVSNIGKMGQDLETARANLEVDAVHQVTRLNTRIESTDQILDKHTIISPLFDFLEQNTVKTVRFTDLKLDTSADGKVTLTLRGQARGYSALALQSDLLNKSKYIRNPNFSNLQLDDKGNVTFTFNSDIDPSLLSYKRVLATGAVAPVINPVTQASTSTPSVGTTTSKTGTTSPKTP